MEAAAKAAAILLIVGPVATGLGLVVAAAMNSSAQARDMIATGLSAIDAAVDMNGGRWPGGRRRR